MGIAGSQFDLTAFPRTIKPEAAGLVDLSRSQFVDPYGLVGIACAVAALAQNGTVELRLPRDDNVRNYLARMNFQTVVDLPNVQPDGALPIVARQDHSDFLLELQHFNDTFGAEAVANLVYTRLRGQVQGALLEQLHESVGELGNNVEEHAVSPVGGFMAAQTYRRNQQEEYLIVAVGDAGIGLRASLERRHPGSSDAEAVKLAVQKDVTGTDQVGRGQGLYYFTDFARSFGWAYIQSGTARRIVGPHESDEAFGHFQGTLIGMRLRCRS
jgi:hypothetical protein